MTSKVLSHRVMEFPVARKEISIGIWIIVLLFGFLLTWANFVALPTAAIAPGLVGIEGYRKTIQHLEGGIVQQILVKDGDFVSQNQILIVLDNLHTHSDYELLRKQRISAIAHKARLTAEYEQADEINFPSQLSADESDAHAHKSIASELRTFRVRRDLLHEQTSILTERISQATTKIAGLNYKINALKKQRNLIGKELKEYRDYAERGLVTRSQVFSLERQNVQVDVDLAQARVSITSTKQEINALRLRLAELNESRTNEVLVDLSATQKDLLKIEQQLAKTNDRLARTNILAPISGVVVGLKIHTTGGVIAPGEPLLDIVPSQENLIIEAKVDPKDRDTVRTGQNAEIRFTAFNQRNTVPVPGKVIHISADRFVDKSTNSSYYNTTIELTESPEKILNGATIFPGMQAEVIILTGTRTALSYLLDPITQSFNRSFRED